MKTSKTILEICLHLGKGECFGDSGGPLTYSKNGQHTLVGAVSGGAGGCGNGFVTTYASVAKLRTWIDETIQANGGATYCKN